MEEKLNNNEIKEDKDNSKIIIIILSILLVCALSFICYDKFINKEKPPVPTPTPTATVTPEPTNEVIPTDTPEPAKTVVIDETVKLKEISIPNYNEEVNIDYNGRIFLIQIKDGHLFIDNKQIVDSNNEPISAQTIYVTDKYILFTAVGQDLSVATYAIDKDGNKVNIVTNNYQFYKLAVEGDYIKAEGHIFCGIDGDCPDKDLIIKYENNTITISPKN